MSSQSSEIPTGTITFLFSDIEGSTRQWEHHAEVMSKAIARHDQLLRECIESNGGYVFKTVGDAFCAAFPTAGQALRAAIASQSDISKEPWPEPIRMRVRMGIHTGAAESRDGDYFGQPLNRVARLLSAGHGGQILLSLPTQELVRDNLPTGHGLSDLGARRLKDLVRPEQIFQVLGPGLTTEFPPLKTLDRVSNNLPIQLTSFVGREREMSEIQQMLDSARLVTLTGSGGAGKTRLALQVAAEVADNFEDGAWLVELAALTEPIQVLRALTQTLNISEEPGKQLVDTLIAATKNKTILVILDNCEHLLDACVEVADVLLRGCPSLQIIATSREPLGIAGERTYRVPSLGLPPPPSALTTTSAPPTAQDLTQYEAVRLFIDRALNSNPGFTVTNENAPALAQLCTRLDGIPLALELAAARCRALSVQEIHSRLDDRFKLLTGGSRTSLPRQKTLRALVDWSYDLLTDKERKLLMQLSVFANGWTLDTAELVCASASEEEGEDVLDRLISLVDKSLVTADTSEAGTRYRLLQTVRDYALERLLESGETELVRSAHRDCFHELANQALTELRGPKQKEWLNRLETDHDNYRAALQWCLTEGDPGAKGLATCGYLYIFWWVRGHWSEGRSWCGQFLKLHDGRPDTAIKGEALLTEGHFALYLGDFENAEALYNQALEVSHKLHNNRAIASALHCVAHVFQQRGQDEKAKPIYEEAVVLRREEGDKPGLVASLNNLANVHQELGNYETALEMHTEALALRREIGASVGISQTLQNLGCLYQEIKNYPRALEYFGQALPLMREARDIRSLAQALNSLGDIAADTGDLLPAIQLWSVAEALSESIGFPLYNLDQGKYARLFAQVREQVGADVFDQKWALGHSMSLEEACDFAMSQRLSKS